MAWSPIMLAKISLSLIALLAKTMFMISLSCSCLNMGPPSSFQVYLIHLVFFFFEQVFLLLQVFLFLYLHLGLWHASFSSSFSSSVDSPSHPQNKTTMKLA